jgi:ABC-type amino acid transport system permease subunit
VGYDFDLKVIVDNLDEFVAAVGMTLLVAAVSMVAALVVGLVVAFMRISRFSIFRAARAISISSKGHLSMFSFFGCIMAWPCWSA